MDDRYFLLFSTYAEFRSLSDAIYLQVVDKVRELTGESEMIYNFIRDEHRIQSKFISWQQTTHITDDKLETEDSDLDKLKKEITKTKKIIDKRYVLDIFDDGEDDTEEMAKALWSGLWLLMKLPLLTKYYYYQFDDGSICIGDEYKTKLLSVIMCQNLRTTG